MLGNQASQQDLDVNQSHKYTKNLTTIDIKQNTRTRLQLTSSKAHELSYD